MFKKPLLAVLFLGLASQVSLAGADRLWLHVSVVEHDAEGDNVNINVPLSLAETVLPMLDDAHMNGSFSLNGREFKLSDLRKIWKEVKESGENEFVTVEGNGDGNVKIARSGQYLTIDADEAKSEVRIRIPVTVVDALLSGKDELDLGAAVDAMQEHGPGDLVMVNEEDSRVHIWVDQKSGAAK